MKSIFDFADYREYLAAAVADKGISGRQFSQLARFKSPNYLQLLITHKRNLSPKNASAVAKALNLDAAEARYFTILVLLDQEPDDAARAPLLAEMQSLIAKNKRQDLASESIYSNWLHAVIWEAARLKDQPLDGNLAETRLRGQTTIDEVNASIDFLMQQGFLQATSVPKRFMQKPISFITINDKRRFELRRNHARFLDLAKLRLNDDMAEREYQGLTMAIPATQIERLKLRVREFVASVRDEFSDLTEPDTIVRVQCCAFKITKDG